MRPTQDPSQGTLSLDYTLARSPNSSAPAVVVRAVQDNMGRFAGVSRSLDGGESWAPCLGWTRDTPLGGVQPLRLAVAPRHAGSTQHFTATARKQCLLITPGTPRLRYQACVRAD